jgi:Spy/CpxP family protein refolding chaperone
MLHHRLGIAAALFSGALLTVPVMLLPPPAAAPAPQRGGRGGISVSNNRARLDTLTVNFKLDGDQKKAIQALFDAAHEAAEPARSGLAESHAAIAAAIQGGQGQPAIDAAVKTYGEHAAAMTAIEMKAMADLMDALTEEQRANNAAISQAFFMLRGAFLERRWNDIPSGRLY